MGMTTVVLVWDRARWWKSLEPTTGRMPGVGRVRTFRWMSCGWGAVGVNAGLRCCSSFPRGPPQR
jgi:hypothetical protein